MIEKIKLTNLATKEEIELARLSTPYFVLGEVEWGAIETQHYLYNVVHQIGSKRNSTRLGTRPITITGWVLSDTEIAMDERKMYLNGLVNPTQEIEMLYKEYTLRFFPTGTIKYATDEKENNEILSKFKIDGICTNPLFIGKEEQEIPAASTIAMFHFPLIISETPNPPGGVVFGLRQPASIVTIINEGSVDTGIKIIFKAKGELLNPKLINADTLEFFKINKTMSRGETIEIDTTIGQKRIEGTINNVTTNYYKYKDMDSKWLQLLRGENHFKYDADENVNDLEVYIVYSNKYIEVQQCY